MASTFRMTVTCDENLTDQCAGLKEYTGPDRFAMAQALDQHTRESGWLRGYRDGATYDVCPSCRPKLPPWGQPQPRSAPNA